MRNTLARIALLYIVTGFPLEAPTKWKPDFTAAALKEWQRNALQRLRENWLEILSLSVGAVCLAFTYTVLVGYTR